MARVLIVGLGNDLAGDDGAGSAVVRELERRGLPPGVRAVAAHTDSLALPSLWAGEDEVWWVDAVVMGEPPGTVRRFEDEALQNFPQRHRGAHELSLPESLGWLRSAYPALHAVRFCLWGIQPTQVCTVEGLSPAVGRAARRAADAILATLAVAARPRPA